MTTSTSGHNTDNVVDLFTGAPYSSPLNRRIIRLAPELDGLEMIYSNESNPTKLFSIKVLYWALRADGEVVGLVPWLDDIMPCTEIQDPLNGHWEGYYDPGIDEVFFEAPIHKVMELETAAEYYEFVCDTDLDVVQEIPVLQIFKKNDIGVSTLSEKVELSKRLADSLFVVVASSFSH